MKNNYFLIIPLLLYVSSCAPFKENLFIGETICVQQNDFITLLEKKENLKYNNTFSHNNFTFKNFYSQIENEAIDLKSKKSLTSLLKNSEKILINVGNYEFLKYIDYSDYNFEYDEKVFNATMELFEYYLTSSIDIMKTYTSNIVVISPFPYLILNRESNDLYLKTIDIYRKIIDDVCSYHAIKVVKPSKMMNYIVKDKTISEIGANYLINQLSNVW